MERFAKLAAQALAPHLHELHPTFSASDLEVPPDPKLGDLAFPCFKLAKQARLAPPALAQKLAAECQAAGALPAEITVAPVGPYVNFTVSPAAVARSILGDILTEGEGDAGLGHYGRVTPETRGTWVLEFGSPNVAKPLNIYHLRSTALGATLDRIGRYRGWKVKSINHLGDWGKQYGMLTVAFKRFGKTVQDDLSMLELVDLYVKINAEAAAESTASTQAGGPKEPVGGIQDQAREAFLKLEKGDPEVTALWRKCLDVSLREFNRIYDRLGVKFDHIWGESYYQSQLAPLLADLRKRNLLVESEGAWVVPVTDEKGREIPPCILEKSDGATIYATRDVAAAIYRYQQFKFDRMTYIVGGEQKLHFQQVFAVLRKMGLPWIDRCEHIPYGLYRFKDAKMSTRKGNFVTLEEVLELAKQRVTELMSARAESLRAEAATAQTEAAAAQLETATPGQAASDRTGEPREIFEPTSAVTEAVAVGALVFYDLHSDPTRDIEFDLERVVDFEGETGPYLQYAHTRCVSILRKAGSDKGQALALLHGPVLGARLVAPQEIALLKMLGQFPMQLERTLAHAKASHLAHYLIDVTQAFGSFYRECRVLTDDRELSAARLQLVESTRRVMARGLSLLGIPLPERM